MDKNTFNISLWIDANIEDTIDLKPENYLDCADTDELWSQVNADLYVAFNKGLHITRLYDYNLDWSYPIGFLKEWEELKRKSL